MKTAFIDTSVISECHRQEITAKALNEILKAKKLTPVVGIYPNFEVAKNILTNNPNRASQLYSFIRDLKPEYSRSRADLYILETNKLRTDEPIDYLLSGQPKTILLNRIDDHCNGKFTYEHKSFVQTRQEALTASRKAWQPVKSKEIRKKYSNNFNKFVTDFFTLLKSHAEKMEYIRIVILIATEQKIILNDQEIIKLIDNLISYPALRTLLYVHLYLEFLTETNGETPAEDRFTDGLIMIESSYCTVIISNDEAFMRKHAKNINAHIETISLKELIGINKTDIIAS